MDMKQFRERYRVKMNGRKHERKYRLTTGEDTVHGRYGEIVEDKSYGDAFAVKFIAVPRNAVMTAALRNRYRAALAGGLTLKHKYGSDESTFHFDPANEKQARLALKLVRARIRRQAAAPNAAQSAARRAFADRRRNAVQTLAP
ncbi:MAG: hypothetical protein WAN12_18835 [Candidatus Acidiferrum sp.]